MRTAIHRTHRCDLRRTDAKVGAVVNVINLAVELAVANFLIGNNCFQRFEVVRAQL